MYRSVKDICNDLAVAIDAKGETQSQVALKLGVNQSQISRILSGEIDGVSKSVLKLCKYADVDPYLASKMTFDPLSDESFVATIRLAVQNSRSRAKKIEGILRATAEM